MLRYKHFKSFDVQIPSQIVSVNHWSHIQSFIDKIYINRPVLSFRGLHAKQKKMTVLPQRTQKSGRF